MIPTRVAERFWSRVAIGADDACWPWQMSCGSHGYGQIGWKDGGRVRMALAHRVAFTLANGPIPDGLTVDHLCHNRVCCNPRHLRLLSNGENGRRNGFYVRDHCGRGHTYTTETIRWRVSASGYPTRACRLCDREHPRPRQLTN